MDIVCADEDEAEAAYLAAADKMQKARATVPCVNSRRHTSQPTTLRRDTLGAGGKALHVEASVERREPRLEAHIVGGPTRLARPREARPGKLRESSMVVEQA